MDELKELVENLEKENDEEKQEKILQNIGKVLITEYEIIVDGIKIEPLWVEAYYYSQNKFADCNTHLDDKQKTDLDNYIFIIKVMADLTYAFQIPMNFTYHFC